MIISDKLPSKLEVIQEFLPAAIEKIKSQAPFKEEDIFNIKLSLEEALVNAIRHGNKLNPALSVSVAIEMKDKRLTIKVTDEGQGFDFKNIPDPTKADSLKKLSGRGVFLIKRLMDEVDFFDGGRGIQMVKYLKARR